MREAVEETYLTIMEEYIKKVNDMIQKLEWANESLQSSNIQENFQKALYLKEKW